MTGLDLPTLRRPMLEAARLTVAETGGCHNSVCYAQAEGDLTDPSGWAPLLTVLYDYPSDTRKRDVARALANLGRTLGADAVIEMTDVWFVDVDGAQAGRIAAGDGPLPRDHPDRREGLMCVTYRRGPGGWRLDEQEQYAYGRGPGGVTWSGPMNQGTPLGPHADAWLLGLTGHPNRRGLPHAMKELAAVTHPARIVSVPMTTWVDRALNSESS